MFDYLNGPVEGSAQYEHLLFTRLKKLPRKKLALKHSGVKTIPSELSNLSFTVLQSPYAHPHFAKQKLSDFETPSWELLDVH